MVRYRAPSQSTAGGSQTENDRQPTIQGNGETSKAESSNTRKQDITSKRRRSIVLHNERLQGVEMAKKREVVRRRIKARSDNHVFVGNVEPTVTERVLFDTFAPCGKITGIQIRCSRGCAINIGRPVDPHERTERDRQYASIEFADQNAVRKALALHGLFLHGVQIVVTICAIDLPEVGDVVKKRMKTLQQLPLPPRSRLKGEKTEPVIDPNAKKHWLIDLFFPHW